MARRLRSNLLLGMAGGIVGIAMMDAYWTALSKIKPQTGGASAEPTTEKVARRVLRRAGIPFPSRQTRAVGGQVVHWGYGTSWGLVTGLARAAGISLDWGGGQLFGAGLWAAGDVWMLYKLGLARHPREYPIAVHASALGAHLAYGLGLWATIESLAKLQHPKPKFLRRAA